MLAAKERVASPAVIQIQPREEPAGAEGGTVALGIKAIGVAGGARKHRAIRGALHGQWVNVLITDRFTAESLITP